LKDNKRDIIVLVCQHNSFEEYETLLGLEDIIVIPVQTINPPVKYSLKRWVDVFTRFNIMKLTNWNRVLIMDVDIFVVNDSFYQIWDEPATQIKNSPPLEYQDHTYMGVQVEDLYPFLHSAAIDTYDWEYNLGIHKYNAGLIILKPSLNIFGILMKISFDGVHDLIEVDQTAGNIVYNKDGAIPWDRFSELYNFFPDHNYMDEKIKAYHCKVWMNDPPPRYKNISDMWHNHYNEMKKNWQLPKPLIEPPKYLFVLSNQTSIIIAGLKVISDQDVYYALVTTNIVDIPTAEQIKEANHASSVFMDNTITLIISGLMPDTVYVVHYYLYIAPLDKNSDLHYVQYSTA
jgi:hypothetical protein